MSNEHLIIKELVVALVGATAVGTLRQSPIVEPYKASAIYAVTGIAAFWCLRLAGVI